MEPIWEAFQAYIRSYLPQWRYDPHSGEPESALLLAAAELIAETGARLSLLPQKHELEFLRGWALEPLGPDPACAFASLDAPGGRPVPAGTELYMSGDGGRLWRTAEDSRAESLRLTDLFLTSGGKMLPLALPAPGRPVPLFDFQGAGLPGPEVRFSHPDAFASRQGCQTALALPEASGGLLALLGGSAARWSLLRASGELVPLPAPGVEGELLRFRLPAAADGRAVQVRLPAASLPAEPLGAAAVHTERLERPPDAAWDGSGICGGERWLPFGEAPEPWRTCCLACPEVLALRGAQLTVSFALSFLTREDSLPGTEGERVYRPVMRRLPPPPPPLREVWADQVLWEYWNGRTWLPIPGTEAYTGCFAPADPDTARVEARFLWPEDAMPCEVGGSAGFWIRWRIGRAENSGWLPRRCHAPEITHLRFSALLEGAPAAVSVRGPAEDVFRPLPTARTPLFQKTGPAGDCWWLGFDAPPSGPLLRLYLTLQGRVPGGRLSAWEAAEDGRERALAVVEDGTQGLSHSGQLAIGGIRGRLSPRFGQRRWWLCLRDDSGQLARRPPRLEELAWGAVCLQADSGGSCRRGEPLSPLRGGALRAVSLTGSFGGSAPEDQAALLRRARSLRHHGGRCVSALDAGQLICGRLRDVLRTRCVREGDTLYVAALMRDIPCHAAAFARRKGEIRRLLERESALPALGLRIEAREPVFYPVGAMVWLRSPDGVPQDTVRRMVCDALDRFLNPAAGRFQGEGWQIGTLPSEMETRNFLQAGLPELAIDKVLLTVTAPDGREMDRSLAEDPYALPLPGAHTVHLLGKEGLLCTT